MALPVRFIFPAASINGIALNQTVSAGANMLINGALQDMPATMGGTFRAVQPGIERTVVIGSSGNLSAVTVGVQGLTVSGGSITQYLSGPNNNYVETTSFFSTVSRVWPLDGDLGTATRVGTGSKGRTNWALLNENIAPFQVGLAVEPDATATVNIETAVAVDPTNLTPSTAITTVSGITSTFSSVLNSPVAAVRSVMTVSAGSGAFIFTVAQAGIKNG